MLPALHHRCGAALQTPIRRPRRRDAGPAALHDLCMQYGACRPPEMKRNYAYVQFDADGAAAAMIRGAHVSARPLRAPYPRAPHLSHERAIVPRKRAPRGRGETAASHARSLCRPAATASGAACRLPRQSVRHRAAHSVAAPKGSRRRTRGGGRREPDQRRPARGDDRRTQAAVRARLRCAAASCAARLLSLPLWRA